MCQTTDSGKSAPVHDPADLFYQHDSTRLTWQEYRWGDPLVVAPLNYPVKWMGIRLPGSSNDPPVKSLVPFQAAAQDVPEEISSKLEADLQTLLGLGFQDPVYHIIHDDLHQTDYYLVSLFHPAHQTCARIHHSAWKVRQPPKISHFCEFLTAFTDGTYLWSLSSKPDLLAPPTSTANRRRNLPAAELWESHQRQLSDSFRARAGKPVPTRDAMLDILEAHHQSVCAFQLERGVFTPLREKDRRRLTKLQQQRAQGGGEVLEHAEVLAEMNKLEEARAGWGWTLGILFLSLLAFVLLTATSLSWEFLLLIIPILFVHELGHYLAMRIFRYRNVRMFFIPFFGAAVSGRSYGAPGWKKVVVALAGPVPSIFLGVVVGVAGLALHSDTTVKIALLTLVLNALNLLPVFPLDGGQIVHTLLFQRHYLLDSIFRALAAVALIAGGAMLGDKILLYFGLFMIFTIPASFRLGRVATDLSKQTFPPPLPEAKGIPTPIAQAIIARLKKAYPKKRIGSRTLAKLAVQTYEAVAARPVGWIATILLGGVHVASLVIAAFFFLVFIFGRQQIQQLRLAGPIATPTHHLTVASLAAFSPTASAAFNPRPPTMLIATFPTEHEAASLFHQLQPDLPANAIIECFGQSLILNLPASDPAAQSAWRGRLEPKCEDLFVDGDRSNTIVTLSCQAPNLTTARTIEEDCNAYFLLYPSGHLIPPWSPADARPLDVKRQQARARRTYRKVFLMMAQTEMSPELAKLSNEIYAAYPQGKAAIHQATTRYDNAVRQRWIQNAQELRRQDDLDPAVIDRCVLMWVRQDTRGYEADLLKQAAAELGQLPLKDGDPTPLADRFSAISGHVRRQLWTVTLTGVQFTRLGDGAPALVKWLSDQGCTDFKYTFGHYAAADWPTSRGVTTEPLPDKSKKSGK